MPHCYQRILVIKPGAVGDLLQVGPTLRALKKKFPTALIDLMVGSEAAAAMFARNPHLHDTVVFDRSGEHGALPQFFRLWFRLRRARYDLVVNFQRSNFGAWLLAGAALPCRILLYRKAAGRTVHAVVNHLETLAPLGIDPAGEDITLELWPGPDDECYAEKLLCRSEVAGKTIIALNPGASHPVNRWPAIQFTLLAERLVKEGGYGVLLVGGGEDDLRLAREITGSATVPILNLVGKTTILALGAVLRRCSVLVSGDTGPMHVATAVGTPVVALFGAADPDRTGPVGGGHCVVQARNVSCVPCCRRTCDNDVHLECMQRITVVDVTAAVLGRLK